MALLDPILLRAVPCDGRSRLEPQERLYNGQSDNSFVSALDGDRTCLGVSASLSVDPDWSLNLLYCTRMCLTLMHSEVYYSWVCCSNVVLLEPVVSEVM